MTAAHQTRDVPYTADQMFALVAGIEDYPTYLPWCAGARIRRRAIDNGNEVLTADLIVTYKVFREQFSTAHAPQHHRTSSHTITTEWFCRHWSSLQRAEEERKSVV